MSRIDNISTQVHDSAVNRFSFFWTESGRNHAAAGPADSSSLIALSNLSTSSAIVWVGNLELMVECGLPLGLARGEVALDRVPLEPPRILGRPSRLSAGHVVLAFLVAPLRSPVLAER